MESLEKKRLFIALNLVPDIRQKIAEIINDLASRNEGIRWVRSAGLHFTLHFLGILSQTQENKVKLIMKSLAHEYGEMEIKLEKIDAFPNIIKPRIIYLNGRQPGEATVFNLQSALGKKLVESGYEIDKRPWKLHLTLGRVKALNLSFKSNQNYKNLPITFKISTFELMESELKPSGAEYSEVLSCQL